MLYSWQRDIGFFVIHQDMCFVCVLNVNKTKKKFNKENNRKENKTKNEILLIFIEARVANLFDNKAVWQLPTEKHTRWTGSSSIPNQWRPQYHNRPAYRQTDNTADSNTPFPVPVTNSSNCHSVVDVLSVKQLLLYDTILNNSPPLCCLKFPLLSFLFCFLLLK